MPCRHRTTKRRLDSYTRTHTHTHTHTVYYALTYIIIWRAEPVRLVRDRVEDRSSATTDCGRSDGGGGIIIWRRAYTCRFDFRISSSPPTAPPTRPFSARAAAVSSVARDRPTDRPPPPPTMICGQSDRPDVTSNCVSYSWRIYLTRIRRYTYIIIIIIMIITLFYTEPFLFIIIKYLLSLGSR